MKELATTESLNIRRRAQRRWITRAALFSSCVSSRATIFPIASPAAPRSGPCCSLPPRAVAPWRPRFASGACSRRVFCLAPGPAVISRRV